MSTATAPVRSKRERFNPASFEQKWRDAWEAAKLYTFDPHPDPQKPKWYAVTMYPYPSGDLHIGHWYAMAPPDAAARYRRMLGYNVFFPMGFDAFGLPAENAAIKRGAHPYKWTMANIENMRRQMRSMGTMFDWDQEVITCQPEYYKWNQWFFLQFLKAGLAYRAKRSAWWCPSCQTVLANEQVIDGRCERCETEVYRRELEQWFFNIVRYAEELLSYDGLDWPERVRTMQRNWIGRSEGAQVTFKTEAGDEIEIFTTRPDTLWGATFMVLAPEHPLVEKLTTTEQRSAVSDYQAHTSRQSEIERQSTDTEKQKTGVFTGGYAINPVNNERVPVWIADYVLMTYGTGAIMAVPAHDERDFQFALKFHLPIVPVIERRDQQVRAYIFPSTEGTSLERLEDELIRASMSFEFDGYRGCRVSLTPDRLDDLITIVRDPKTSLTPAWCSYVGARTGWIWRDGVIELDSVAADQRIIDLIDIEPGRITMEVLRETKFFTEDPDLTFHHDYGTMINSGELTGTPGDVAVSKTIEWLQARGIGRGEVNYRLRDWSVSRQRYWGTPIPIIYCDEHGAVPVPEKDLPVVLPLDAEFKPTGESPLKYHEEFLNAPCPVCDKPGRRDSDTMDTFVDSSWYMYRYLSPHDDELAVDPDLASVWLPIDQYTGGIEHATMHLMYARFFTKAMRDIGLLSFGEPFTRLFNQGIILGEDNEKMSKSRGNVVDPDELVARLGADTVRLFLMFLGPWDQGGPWNSQGIAGIQRFLERSNTVISETASNAAEPIDDDATRALRRITHQVIRDVTEDIDGFQFNTMIAELMEFVNDLMRLKDTPVAHTAAWKEATDTLALLLAPIAPHTAEEFWHRLGRPFSIHQQTWPTWDPALAADETIEIAVQVNGKVRDHITLTPDTSEADALTAAKASPRVAPWLEGKTLVREMYVPGRLVNLAVRE
jgi:leucyl-tRNA synthetase